VEPVSDSTFFADFAGCSSLKDGPESILGTICASPETGDVSVFAGFAPSKYLAWAFCKTMQDSVFKGHPAGENASWLMIDKDNVLRATARIPIKYMWGMDTKASTELEILGFKTFRDIEKAGIQNLTRRFAKRGKKFFSYSTGLDQTAVLPLYPPRVISAERDMGPTPDDGSGITPVIAKLVSELHEDLLHTGLACQRLILSVKTSGEIRRATKDFPKPRMGLSQLTWTGIRMFLELTPNTGQSVEIEWIQIVATALCLPVSVQNDLLGEAIDAGESSLKRSMVEIAPAIGNLERRYGTGLVQPCTSLLKEELRRETMLSYWDPVRWRDSDE